MSAIKVENLAKSYVLSHRAQSAGKYLKLSDMLVASARSILERTKGNVSEAAASKEIFWALNDVSFDVKEGERVGVIGRNGAGKSTLLKLISRITAPTRGKIHIAGRVSSLLEVGTGFHPELTGRENIFLNGSVLGMSRADIQKRFDAIVQFAEVERFLDTAVKHYSSGMYMRLAFAVAAHLEPDILIVDEVLAVGDAAFQKKCLGKMKDVGAEGRTVLFVSHNMGAISEFCNRAILLDQGGVLADDAPSKVIPIYAGGTGDAQSFGCYTYEDKGTECWINAVSFRKSGGEISSKFELIEQISIEIHYLARSSLQELQITVTLLKDGIELIHAFDNDDEVEIIPTPPGQHRTIYTLPARILKEGVYSVRVTAGLPRELIEDIQGPSFEVVNNTLSTLKKSFRSDRTGAIASPGRWQRFEAKVSNLEAT
jgi:lipopolysaccharide transport system ATP-binding protein